MRKVALLLCAAFLIPGPAFGKITKKATKTNTLYHRLGGMKAIKAVVNDFVGTCATDDRIKGFFTETAKDPKRLAAFKTNLTNQICQLAEGPCQYKGKSMDEAHKGMGIQEEHFNAFVEDLTKSLDKFKVKEEDKTTLLGVLGPMKAQVVEKKSS